MTNFERRFLSASFDPATIPPYSVIRAPLTASGEEIGEKLVVVLCHRQGHAVCLKATSNTAFYINNPERMRGCVFYRANEVPFLHRDTVIQPDNHFAVPHSKIDNENRVLGALPADFPQKLRTAIENSATIPGVRKRSILTFLT